MEVRQPYFYHTYKEEQPRDGASNSSKPSILIILCAFGVGVDLGVVHILRADLDVCGRHVGSMELNKASATSLLIHLFRVRRSPAL